MNVVAHRNLWSAIQQFPLDEHKAAIPFSKKLAAEQNWSPAFTQQAIEEYRKFIFLCCIAPKGASPSKIVDEVWHLHLTYTQSYWIKWCKETLGKDIHHYPSRGGEDEDHKHENWYTETLQLYESIFESQPPANIWPPPEHHVEIFVPEPNTDFEIIALTFLLILIPFGISFFTFETSPFNLKGPQFLIFLPLLAFSCFTSYIIWQYSRLAPLLKMIRDHFPVDANIFQIAHFLYGQHRAIQTGIIDLVRRNLLQVTHDKFFKLSKSQYVKPAKEQNLLISGFLQADQEYVMYETIANKWYQDVEHPILNQFFQIAYKKESFWLRFSYLLIPIAAGGFRLMKGLLLGKPVSYLVIELVVLFLLSLLVAGMFSKKRLLYKEAAKMAKRCEDLRQNEVVSEFAFKGNKAIGGFAEALILTSIFGLYPATYHAGINGLDRSINRGDGDSSGDGYGNSCSGGGGSCGGGGCGGCGGGD